MKLTRCLRAAGVLAVLSSACLGLVTQASFAGDRLLATGGVMEIEGSAGGGLTPWALIAGLGTDQQFGASGFCTQVEPQDFKLDSCGVAIGLNNRLELSVARQAFSLGATVPGQQIDVSVVGAKLRVAGDAVLDQGSLMPQIALGVQYKHNSNFDLVPKALGAKHAQGTDLYLAATKVWLDGPLGRSWLLDVTLRDSEANQLGILGFGGDRGGYHLLGEGSLGVFLADPLILGAEYRQKPDNLSVFREQDFKDLFLAYFPGKYFSITVAYADLGTIANQSGEQGSYVSLQASW